MPPPPHFNFLTCLLLLLLLISVTLYFTFIKSGFSQKMQSSGYRAPAEKSQGLRPPQRMPVRFPQRANAAALARSLLPHAGRHTSDEARSGRIILRARLRPAINRVLLWGGPERSLGSHRFARTKAAGDLA